MPSPPSSVIVLDDSSDDDLTLTATGRRSAPLLVSSSDDSDDGSSNQAKNPPKFSFSVTARKVMGSSSEAEEEEVSDEENDTNAKPLPQSKKKTTQKKVVKTKSSVVQYSGTAASDEEIAEETTQLRFADSDGRMYSDVMSFSELQAQQREFEFLQAQAQRAKSASHNNVRRKTITGAKRKASEAVASSLTSPHSRNKSSVMKKTTSPSPFEFDFPGSGDESSASSTSPDENRATMLGIARAKAMSLKDVVAQERELARLRNGSGKKKAAAAPPKKKKKAAPKQPQFSFGGRKNANVIDGTQWSSCEPSEVGEDDVKESKPDTSFESEPPLNEPSSESDEKISDEEEYTPIKSKQPTSSFVQPTDANDQKVKPELPTKDKKSNQSSKSSKSKAKKSKSISRSSSAKAVPQPPPQNRLVSDTLDRQRNATDTVMHATVWRNVCFDTAPPNLLSLDSETAPPFNLEHDRALLTYDVDGDLRSKCKLVPHFGKSTQFLSSTLEPEPGNVITQEDMDTRVTEVIQRELPRIRACHQRKTSAIIAEARIRTKIYLTSLETHLELVHDSQEQVKRLGDVSALEKSLLNQMKQEKLTQALSLGYSNVWGETISVEERLFPHDVNQLPCIRPMSKSTAYVGVNKNVRVEDDPILRYKPYFGEDDDGADIDEAWYDAIESKDSTISSGLDGEVNEFLLRLVVRECGTSDKVFNALKKVPGFAQAYSDYADAKKLDDSMRLAARRLKEAKELISTKPAGFPLAKVAALEPSLGNVLDSEKTLEERLAPPPTYFDSNLARGHANRGYGLGLRSSDDYTELLVTYRDMFCRICYVYHCLEHGIEHPLPSHRIDPINPPLFLSPVAFAANAKRDQNDDEESAKETPESSVSTASPPVSVDVVDDSSCTTAENAHSQSEGVHTDEDVAIEPGSIEMSYETVTEVKVTISGDLNETRRSSRALTRISTLASTSLKKQDWRPSRKKATQRFQHYPQVPDESEYLDDSHYDEVTAIVKSSLQTDEKCSSECWKAKSSSAITDASDELTNGLQSLSDTEVVLLRKLRGIIGDNPCMISSMVESTTCQEVGTFLESERQSKPIRSSSMDDVPLSPDARLNNNGRKRGRARNSRSSNNRILLNRTRNNRLKDKGANHEYEPCNHEGACDTTDCSCMTRDHTCDKACSCSRDCPNRFPGCKCSLGNCRTKACPCFIAARECNPDLCFTCGASEVPALIFDEERRNMSALDLGICCNVNILRGLHKKIGVAYSTTHGWGAFAMEPIKRGEFIYEYHGALLSQDEAERRGSIYDKMTISFLFDVDDDAVVDAIRKGNKSKFANHSAVYRKCKGRVLTVGGGEHRISIWAQQDIAKGEELFFDYGYHGETAPDWSQLRIKGSARRGTKKKSEEVDKKE